MFILPDSINYSPHLSTPEKNFLRCLSSHCGSKAVAWPSMERIARFMNTTVRTAQRTLRRILELKLLEIIPRRGKTNLFRLLCLEERKLSTPPTQPCHPEQNTPWKKEQRLNGSGQRAPWGPIIPDKPWREVKEMLKDIAEVMGAHLTKKNHGWFTRIARACSWEQVQDALHAVRQAVLESEFTNEPIRNPSGLFTWTLRQAGAPI